MRSIRVLSFLLLPLLMLGAKPAGASGLAFVVNSGGASISLVDMSAEKELRRVAEEIASKYPDAIGIAAVHRTGDLDVGDLAVVVGVSCAHRAEAFHACHALIDELKATVPIWKHQRFTDGTDEWVGSA